VRREDNTEAIYVFTLVSHLPSSPIRLWYDGNEHICFANNVAGTVAVFGSVDPIHDCGSSDTPLHCAVYIQAPTFIPTDLSPALSRLQGRQNHALRVQDNASEV
jgi:hypothetical protein